MTILDIQARLTALGYQWQEKVFNDGSHNDCMISIAQDTNCHTFSHNNNLLGDVWWGRFPRVECWDYVSKWMDEKHPEPPTTDHFTRNVVVRNWVTGRLLLSLPPLEGYRMMGASARFDNCHWTEEVRTLNPADAKKYTYADKNMPVTFHME